MNFSEKQFTQELKIPDLPPEVGEYINSLEKKLESIQPMRGKLSSIPLDKLTNQEIDELTNLNLDATKVLKLIRMSRDKKSIINEEEFQYELAIEKLKEKLGFPEKKKIQTFDVKIGGKTKDQLKRDLDTEQYSIDTDPANHILNAKYLLNSNDFEVSKEVKNLRLVRLSIRELGFPEDATTDQIYKRADELGLDLCPAEVGPQLRLQSQVSEVIHVAMKGIAGSDGELDVFYISYSFDRPRNKLLLKADDARPDTGWYYSTDWVFSLRPPKVGRQV